MPLYDCFYDKQLRHLLKHQRLEVIQQFNWWSGVFVNQRPTNPFVWTDALIHIQRTYIPLCVEQLRYTYAYTIPA